MRPSIDLIFLPGYINILVDASKGLKKFLLSREVSNALRDVVPTDIILLSLL